MLKSENVDNNLHKNILGVIDAYRITLTQLIEGTGISKATYARIFNGTTKSLSPENQMSLSLFSRLSIEELLYLNSHDLLVDRIDRRQGFKYNTPQELFFLIQEDIAKNWEADKELMK